MYFSKTMVLNAISALSSINSWFGSTYLVCKKNILPIGKPIEFQMDKLTKEFMIENNCIHPNSKWYFQPFKSSGRDKRWLRPDYPSKGLQALNTRSFNQAFIHDKNSRLWGWQDNYIKILKTKLPKNGRISAFHLSVWIFKKINWDSMTKPADILNYFIKTYKVSKAELDQLFDLSLPSNSIDVMFQDHPVEWSELSFDLQPPPDAGPDPGGTLSFLELKYLGSVRDISFSPARRLNIITGDNGLGKSFLLECSWWGLTGSWPELPAYPNIDKGKKESSITFEITGRISHPERKTIIYDVKSGSWPRSAQKPTIPGLIIYARVDGSFAVWDPARFKETGSPKAALVFSPSDVWNGLTGSIEGLIRDWIRWQTSNTTLFDIFCKILKQLSPPDLGELKPGEPIRILNDPRDIPTIIHSYGKTPILFISAGIRRIITLAYLIVWAWNEHKVYSTLHDAKPESRMVILIDELESHLHPKWQRVILPALLEVQSALSKDLKIQFIITTHSPLVLASAEPVFNNQDDKLLHFKLEKGNQVKLEELTFIKFGQVNSWLTSPIFEMRHARSREAEEAIEQAKTLQLKKTINKEEVQEVHDKLVQNLAANDQFWPRWNYFAERNGVKI